MCLSIPIPSYQGRFPDVAFGCQEVLYCREGHPRDATWSRADSPELMKTDISKLDTVHQVLCMHSLDPKTRDHCLYRERPAKQ